MNEAFKNLDDWMAKQRGEAERSASAYRAQAELAGQLRAGLEDSLRALRRAGGDDELELFLLGQIVDAAKAELANAKEAASYAATADRHRAAIARLRAKMGGA